MEREELYKQAGFSSLREYLQVQFKRLNAPKGTISTWRRVGEGYLDNTQFIEAYRIQIKRNVIKQSMLTEALMRFDRAEVAESHDAEGRVGSMKPVYPFSIAFFRNHDLRIE
jgi:hypothetical protein